MGTLIETFINSSKVLIDLIVSLRGWGFAAQTTLAEPVAEGAAGRPETWLDGVYEGNFVVMSVVVGVVMVAALLYLIRRMTPPSRRV